MYKNFLITPWILLSLISSSVTHTYFPRHYQTSTRCLLQTQPVKKWLPLSAEINQLKKKFDAKQTFKNQPIKLDYNHIFEWQANKTNCSWHGFHHDWQGELERQGAYKARVTKTTSQEFYQAQVLIGRTSQRKTFFPKKLPRTAIANLILDGIKKSQHTAHYNAQTHTWQITHRLSPEVNLRIAIDRNGIVRTAYPIIK